MGLTITLVRGLPGSGKTTIAKAISAETGAKHLEADMFFMENGVYLFDGNKIKEAHGWCQRNASDSLSQGHCVVVSNTFVKKWEMDAYCAMAATYGANVKVLVATGSYGNLHEVPEDVVARMRANWEA